MLVVHFAWRIAESIRGAVLGDGGKHGFQRQQIVASVAAGLDAQWNVEYDVYSNPQNHEGDVMKTIQMTIDEPLLAEVDELIQALNTTRSAFIREALELALKRYAIAEMEKSHAEGYTRHPVEPGEFDVWEDQQAWGGS